MTTNTRVSLTILSLGFGIEGGAELYSFLSHGVYRPGTGLLFGLPLVLTLAGLLFVWIGQHEWNALHRSRVRRAHVVFGVSLLGALTAGATVVVLVLRPGLGVPLWARAVFGASIGSLVLGTFITYALLVFHLVPRSSKAVLLASLLWALVVAALVGASLAADLPTVLAIISQRAVGIPNFVAPVDSLASYLFVSYFLLLTAYVDAHRTVARGADSAVGELPSKAPSIAGRSPPDP
jgi:hypothetical protein